jgi:hypothetical protein
MPIDASAEQLAAFRAVKPRTQPILERLTLKALAQILEKSRRAKS